MSELCYFIVFCLDVVILCVHVFMLLTERFIHILHYHYTKFYIGTAQWKSQTFNFKERGREINFFFFKRECLNYRFFFYKIALPAIFKREYSLHRTPAVVHVL